MYQPGLFNELPVIQVRLFRRNSVLRRFCSTVNLKLDRSALLQPRRQSGQRLVFEHLVQMIVFLQRWIDGLERGFDRPLDF